MTFDEAGEYLLNVANVLGNVLLHRQIYNDFCNNLDPEKTQNIFVGWCIQNYRDCLLLNLCKILEPKKDDNKYTLRFFVEYCRSHYDEIREKMATAKRVWHSGHVDDLSGIMLEIFNSIDFNNDLTRIDFMLSQMKNYRDKHLCHSDVDGVELLPPEIIEMHSFVDELNEMIVRYFKLFRRAICNYGITHLKYHDFTLHMP